MKLNTTKRKRFRVSNKVKKVSSNDRFRLSISRSSKNISAQIVDDNNNKTLVSATSIKKNVKNKKADTSLNVATSLAKKALEKNLIILMSGLYSNVIRLAPPLIITENELKTGLNTLCEVIHDYH